MMQGQQGHSNFPQDGSANNSVAAAAAAAAAMDAATTQMFPSDDLPNSVDWSKVDIPGALSQAHLSQTARSYALPPELGGSISAGGPRRQFNNVQPNRASWDGARGTPAPYGDFDSRQPLDMILANKSGFNVANLPLGSEGESSDAGYSSTGSTKRRRMTISGVDSLHEAGRGRPHVQPQNQTYDTLPMQPVQSQTQFVNPAMPAPVQHRSRKHQEQGLGSSGAPPLARQHSVSGLVNSKRLEEMAQESLQRASAENRRTTDHQGNLSAMPSNLASHPLQQSQTHHPSLPRQQSPTGGSADNSHGPAAKRFSASDLAMDAAFAAESSASATGQRQDSHVYHTGAQFPPSAPGHMGGSAASHPPGLGSSVLKGIDPASTGSAAANDFTRRKGWSNRVVDELLDFAHVLDPTGKIMYATNSIQSLTGWSPSELKGKSIYDIVHSQDLPALRRELHAALEDPNKQITMYYRLKRNPSQLAARAKTRLDNASNTRRRMERSRSNSEATMTPTDSSSMQTPSESNSGGPGVGIDRRASAKANPAAVGELDPDAEWVTMEMTGHAYFPPVAAAREREEELQQKANERRSGETLRYDAGEVADDEDFTRAEDASHSQRGSMEEDGRSRPSLFASPPSKRRTYDLPLEREADALCLFCSCRVYPTKSVLLLDSFLELKLENEKLRLELEQLNISEEAAGVQGAQEERRLSGNITTTAASPPLGGGDRSEGNDPAAQDSNRLRPSASAGGEKLGNKVGSGASGGDGSSSVTVGGGADDTEGVSVTANSTATTAAELAALRKKKVKPTDDDEDRVCTDCGRTDSPEWRKGPLGPKTLCNACGLRYAKKVKRQPRNANASGVEFPSGAGGSPSMNAAAPPSMAGSPMQGMGSSMGVNGMGGGVGMGFGGSPMAAMGASGRPSFSAMDSFSTDSSIAGSTDYRSLPMEQGGSFQQPGQFQTPGAPASRLSQDFSMGGNRPMMQHQASSNFGNLQDQMQQQQRQQRALAEMQQREFAEMQQRHHQQLQRQQEHFQPPGAGAGGGSGGGNAMW